MSALQETETTPAPGVLLARGVCRCLIDHGLTPIVELPTPDGLRMDVCALTAAGEIWCVEVKSSRADFLSDAKWQGYLAWCDRFAFAVPEGFPDALLPRTLGLIRADAHEGAILRQPPLDKLAPARRKAMTLRFAQAAALRLLRAADR
ncbi:MAG: MmcB family DNA repair protein [Pseudomonadota bacterium]